MIYIACKHLQLRLSLRLMRRKSNPMHFLCRGLRPKSATIHSLPEPVSQPLALCAPRQGPGPLVLTLMVTLGIITHVITRWRVLLVNASNFASTFTYPPSLGR